MAKKSEVYNQLLQHFYSGSIDEILQDLKQLNSLQQSGELSVKDKYDLQVHAFQTLKDMTVKTSGKAKSLILHYLLPQCLEIHPEASVFIHQHRECLRDWLDQYPEPERKHIRDEVLDSLYLHLKSSAPQTACWTVAYIGYRTGRIVEALWNIINHNDKDVGDTAISTLTGLGVPSAERGPILSALHKRIGIRYNRSLVSALTRLADPTTMDTINDYWLAVDEHKLSALDRSLVFNIFRAILDNGSENRELQNKIWRILTNLATESPNKFSPELYLSQIGPLCNSQLVVPALLGWVATETDAQNSPARSCYLIGLRLEECIRPYQLAGWKQLNDPAAIELLRQNACQDAGYDGFSTTKEILEKEQAWKTLLCTGHLNILDWFDAAVVNETGRLLQKRTMKLFACFRLDPLPETVTRWITERYDLPQTSDGRKYARPEAATRIARSAASREAFDDLLNFGFTVQGDASRESAEALAEVAAHLVKKGETSVVDVLVDVVINSTQRHQRVAAAQALDYIASFEDSLLLKYVEQIIPTLYETERESPEKGFLITSLGYLKDWQIPDKFLADLKDWAYEPDRWLGASALGILVRHGHLHKDHRLLREVLGLEEIGESWDLSPVANRASWAYYIIGLLYHASPDTFLPAMVALLHASDWYIAIQPIQLLNDLYGNPDQPSLPKEIRDALIKGVHNRQSEYRGETETFRILPNLAPEELAEEAWPDVWTNWLPDSRVALADALGMVNLETAYLDKVVSHLQLLTFDGQFSVRRAAYRGLARQNMKTLYMLCLLWSRSKVSTMELRQRAAEACGWLSEISNEDSVDAFTELYEQLASDPEKVVRETAKQTWEARRNRIWAEDYLAVIREVEGQTNKEILEAWCYSEALSRIGDDACIYALHQHLGAKAHPPNVRYWLQRIIEKMGENWRKTTQKWPEPWFVWAGEIKEGRGKIYLSADEPIEINYSIWLQPVSTPSQIPTWGGAIWLPSIQTLGLDGGGGIIELENGEKGEIIMTKSSGEITIFDGNGPYPT